MAAISGDTDYGEQVEGDNLVSCIERSARESANFRRALANVFPNVGDPTEVWERLDLILGTSVWDRHERRQLNRGPER
jgi:hypothetical protein